MNWTAMLCGLRHSNNWVRRAHLNRNYDELRALLRRSVNLVLMSFYLGVCVRARESPSLSHTYWIVSRAPAVDFLFGLFSEWTDRQTCRCYVYIDTKQIPFLWTVYNTQFLRLAWSLTILTGEHWARALTQKITWCNIFASVFFLCNAKTWNVCCTQDRNLKNKPVRHPTRFAI